MNEKTIKKKRFIFGACLSDEERFEHAAFVEAARQLCDDSGLECRVPTG